MIKGWIVRIDVWNGYPQWLSGMKGEHTALTSNAIVFLRKEDADRAIDGNREAMAFEIEVPA